MTTVLIDSIAQFRIPILIMFGIGILLILISRSLK